MEAARAGRLETTRWLRTANERIALLEAFKTQDVSELISALDIRAADAAVRAETVAQRLAASKAAAQQLEAERDVLANLKPGEIKDSGVKARTDIPGTDILNSVLAAKRRSEADLAFRKTRLTALTALVRKVEEQAEDLEATRKTLERLLGLRLEIEFLVRILSDRGRSDRASLPEAVRTSDPAVVAQDTARKALDAAAAETEAVRKAVAAARESMAGRHDPVKLDKIKDKDGFAAWRAAQGLEAVAEDSAEQPDIPATATGPAVSVAPAASEVPKPAEAKDTGDAATPLVATWKAEIRRRRDQLVAPRLVHYRKRGEGRAALITALTTLETRIEAERATAENALEAARRSWGSATTLKRRAVEGRITDPWLEGTITPFLDRQPVILLQDRVTALENQLKETAEERKAADIPAVEEALIAPVSAWSEGLTAILEALSEAQRLEQHYAAIDTPDQLDELERRMLEREIEARISADQGAYRMIGSYFGSQETGTIDQLLERYYSRLITLEQRIETLDARRAQVETVIEATTGLRTALEPVLEPLGALIARSEQDLEIALTQVRAQLDPARAAALSADLEARIGVRIPPAELLKPTDGTPAGTETAAGDDAAASPEALAAARRSLIEGLIDDWAMVAGYRRWLQQIRKARAPLGSLDTRIAGYRDLDAQLDTIRRELNRTVQRLVGYAPAELDKLTGPIDDRSRYALGEIGLLQKEQQSLLHWQVLQSVISLIVIPVVALILIFLTDRFGRRFVARTIGDPQAAGLTEAKKRERIERIETLFGVFHQAARTIILILAGIYILQVINIDVTPIIASLGIFGLAVAFGAQATMKDVFAGFFLLLENQLNVGDWVTINGKVGQVESIGLRLTQIRDWQSGTVHFFPNGTIQHVTSWSKEWAREFVDIHVPFDEPPDRARAAIETAIAAVRADPDAAPYIRNITISPGIVSFNHQIGAQAIRVDVEMFEAAFSVAWKLRHQIAIAFDEAGIRMSMPHAMVHHTGAGATVPPVPPAAPAG